ncbi:hypothetical protein [Herbaspirillum sp. NPDC101397]|uniref:hypothetical protein n=1 Tax=Herbaspirillum sp. NPDC101397 TaxID=3364006 RepID=UPI00383AAB5B
MSAKDFARELKEIIEGIKAKGNDTIQCDALITYLANIESTIASEATPLQLEQFKAQLQGQLEVTKRMYDGQLEMFRSVIASGPAAIKTGFLLNGGAAIAMLAFIGHLAQHVPAKVYLFSLVLAPFAFGVLSGAMLSGLTYLSQWLYASPRPKAKKFGFGVNILCILVGFFGYGLFAWGLCRAYTAFLTF